jgi:hypothetical protein
VGTMGKREEREGGLGTRKFVIARAKTSDLMRNVSELPKTWT